MKRLNSVKLHSADPYSEKTKFTLKVVAGHVSPVVRQAVRVFVIVTVLRISIGLGLSGSSLGQGWMK